MATLGRATVEDDRPRRRSRKGSLPIPPPVPELDWADAADEGRRRSPHRRTSRNDEEDVTDNFSSRPPTSASRRPPRRSHSDIADLSSNLTSTDSMRASRTGPGLRSSTASSYRRPAAREVVPRSIDDASRTASRRSDSRRDYSPSAYHERSSRLTPISSRTSLSGPSEDSEVVYDLQRERRRDGGKSRVQYDHDVMLARVRNDVGGSGPSQPGRMHYHGALAPEPTSEEEESSPTHSVSSSRSSSPAYTLELPRRSRHTSPDVLHHAKDYQRSVTRYRQPTQKQVRAQAQAESAISSRGLRRHHESERHPPRVLSHRAKQTSIVSGSASTASRSVASSSRRSSSFLGGFFGNPHHSHSAEKPVKMVECIVCMDDLSCRKTVKLKCGHRMCNSCLKRTFKLSLTDAQHMPPKCCTSDNIPLKHVDRLFDVDFKKLWNKKLVEFSARDRVYCPAKRCGEFIKPEDIHSEEGRRVGKCGRCKTKVCVTCSGKWHTSRDCPRDAETNKLLAQAKTEGWQRCFRCKSMVELREGCNHMTCRCGAEFCMVCGAKWRTCECPWFNFEAVEHDRLEHMNEAYHGSSYMRHEAGPSIPRDAFDYMTQSPQRSYDEQLLRRQRQEEHDADYTRRLDRSTLYHDHEAQEDNTDNDSHDDSEDIVGIRNMGTHHMRDNYRRPPRTQAPTVSSQAPPAAPTAPHIGTPPTDRNKDSGDYLSGVNRARGVRASSSLEQRLADRLNHNTGTSPTQRPIMSQSPHFPPVLQASMTMPLPQMPSMMMPPPVPIAPHSPRLHRRSTGEPSTSRPKPPRHGPSKSADHPNLSRRSSNPVYAETVDDTASTSSSMVSSTPKSRKHHQRDLPKSSVMAGLTGRGSGANRVTEWRHHVEPGVPENAANVKAKRK